MAVITRGFGGRRRDDTDLPPGQYRTDDFSLCPARETAPTRPVALRFKIHVALSHSPGLMAVAYSRAVCG